MNKNNKVPSRNAIKSGKSVLCMERLKALTEQKLTPSNSLFQMLIAVHRNWKL